MYKFIDFFFYYFYFSLLLSLLDNFYYYSFLFVFVRVRLLHLLSRAYLRDVVEIAHIFYKIMEKFCKGRVVVQDKRKGRKKGKSKAKKLPKKRTAEEENVSTEHT